MKGAKRLTFMVTSLYGGGAERQLVRLALAMADRGWSVSIVSLLERNDFAERLAERGVVVQTLHLSREGLDPTVLSRTVRALWDTRPTLVCAFMTHAIVLARLTGRLAGASRVISSIRTPVLGGKALTSAVRLTDRLSIATVMNSAAAVEAMTSQGVVSRSRARMIPNALDDAGAAVVPGRVAELREELRLDQDTFTWLIVGRLEVEKAHEVLFRALASLRSAGSKTKLLVAGEGSRRAELVDEAASLGLADAVSFLGYRSDVPYLLQAVDGLVLPSRWEGLPNVVMEAMLARVPVVATDVGGTRELVANGETGFLVRPDDAEELALAMRSLMSLDATDRGELVTRAWEHVSTQFAPERVMNMWEELFLSTLGEGRG